jgi:hypothetical protein
MPNVLSEKQVELYHRDGYHFPIDVLSPLQTQELRSALEAYEAKTGGPIRAEMRHKSHLVFTWLNDLIRRPELLDPVEDVIGRNILCWSTSFFIKEPQDPGFVSWHQDATYWGLNKPDVTTLWLAITPANKMNGCMKFVAGTHTKQVAHTDTFNRANLLTRGQEVAVDVDETEAIYVELKPGQASLHHVLLFHGSAPNKSEDRRIGLAIRYVPTHVRQEVGQRDSATLVRGVDAFKYFDPEPRPASDLHPDGVAFHKAVTETQLKVLYRGTDMSQYRD